jgi:hypothetical protein
MAKKVLCIWPQVAAGFPVTNTLAYLLASTTTTKKKGFIGLTPGSEGKNGCKDPDTGDLEQML